jgi:SAM-dependent methyltransferase
VKRCLRCDESFVGDAWQCPACGHAPADSEGVTLFAPELAIEGDGYDSEIFDELVQVEDQSWWFRTRNTLILDVLRRVLPGAGTVLEIGCGTGYVLRALNNAGYVVTGSELFPRGIEHARARVPAGTFVQLDARNIPYREEFDVVAAFDVLEHIPDDQQVMREMALAAKPGGGVLITVPQHPWMWSKADDHARHERRYTRVELLQKLERAELEPVLVTSFVTLALPAMIVARFFQRNARNYNFMDEFRIPAWLNALLSGLATVERRLVRMNVPLPVGGSLLVAARRPSR